VDEPLWSRLHGVRVVADPVWRNRLAAAGIDGFPDLDRFVPFSVGRENRSVVHVPEPGNGPGFFLKRYRYRGWRILRTFLYRAKASREAENLRRLEALGIPAVRPAAWGARRRFGFLADSFLVTESRPGATNARALVTDYLTGRPAPVPRDTFRAVLNRVVDDLATLHAQGIFLFTAFEKNLLVWRTDTAAEYAWVDLPFGGRFPPGRLPVWLRVRDLACLNKGLDAVLTRADRLRLLRRYAGPGTGRAERRDLAARVLRATRVLRDQTPVSRLVRALKGR